MTSPITIRTFLPGAAAIALAVALPVASSAGAQTSPPNTFHACYVPSVGAIYMIRLEGLPAECLGSAHAEITWTDGAGSAGTITEVTAGDGLTGGGTSGAVSLDVTFGGPGSATSVARSDHMHAAAGTGNTAIGTGAFAAGGLAGFNTAIGFEALAANNNGVANTALGAGSLKHNVSGSRNMAFGDNTLWSNVDGRDNIAIGRNALFNHADGLRNIAIGDLALDNVTAGDGNIGLGVGAGGTLATGSDNIYIGNAGANTESGVIRIGNPATATAAHIAGVHGNSPISAAIQVMISSDGRLGSTLSSARFKEDIQPLEHSTNRVMRLRPVRFRYIEPAVDGSRPQQYGLIAEEVAEVFPELVAYDSAGAPLTVYYQFIPVLVLDELQRKAREIEELREGLAAQAAAMEELRAELRSKRR